VAWRLTRTSAVTAAALVVVATVYLVVTGLHLRAAFDSAGLGECLASGSTSNPCLDAAFALHELARGLGGGQPIVGLLALVPGMLGAFVGAPLVAREIESGTLRLAWTQSVTRRRWLIVRVAVALGLVVSVQAGLSVALGFWRGPLDALQGRLETNAYDVQGVVPVGYAVLTCCVAVVAGVLARRTLVALGIALAGFVVVRLLVATVVRPRLLPTVAVTSDDPRVPFAAVVQQQVDASGATQLLVHPSDQFWPMQLVELGLLLALSAALLALAWHRIRRLSV
jgi:hypothetical protein